jgi:hypothetical protein
MNKFQAEKAKIPGRLLAEHSGGNRGSFIRNQAGSRGRWSGNCQLDNLFSLKKMRGSNASPCGADVQCFRKFNKLHAQRVRAPEEDGDLDANAGMLPLVRGRH